MTANWTFSIDAVNHTINLFKQIRRVSFLLTFIRILTVAFSDVIWHEDFFHSFFDSEENDLNQKSRVKTLRNDIVKVKNEDRGEDDVISDKDRIASNERINADIVNSDDEDIQMTSHHLLTSKNLSNTKEEKTRENTRKSRRT